MNRTSRDFSYSGRCGSTWSRSLGPCLKDIDEQEFIGVTSMPRCVPAAKSKYDRSPQSSDGGSPPSNQAMRKRKEFDAVNFHGLANVMCEKKRLRQEWLWPGGSKGDGPKDDRKGGEKKGSCEVNQYQATGYKRNSGITVEGTSRAGSGVIGLGNTSFSEDADVERSGVNTSTLTSVGDSRTINFALVPRVVLESSARFTRYASPSGSHRDEVTEAVQVPSLGPQDRVKRARNIAEEVIKGRREKSLFSVQRAESGTPLGSGVFSSKYHGKAREGGCQGSIETGSHNKTKGLSSGNDGWSYLSQGQQNVSVLEDMYASCDSVTLSTERGSNSEPFQFKAGVLSKRGSVARSIYKGTALTLTDKTGRLSNIQENQNAWEDTYCRKDDTSSASSPDEEVSLSVDLSVGGDGYLSGSQDCVRPEPKFVLSSGRLRKTQGEEVPPTVDVSVGGDGYSSGSQDCVRPEPNFVLSSGRLSKTQEAQLGIRPSTIDDDFDQYFAQLML